MSGTEAQLSITVSGVNNATPSAAETVTSGEYTASYTPTNAGTDNIAIELSGEPITGSPFTSDVITSDISPSNSTVTADPTTLQAGSSSTVTVLLRDGSDNPIGGLEDSDFAIAVSGNAGAGSVSETSTGTYQFSVTNNTAEQVTVTVNADGVDLQDTPIITFDAADADLMIITRQPAETVAGENINGPPSVRITDEFGNRVEGFDVSVSEQSGQDFASGTLTVQTNSSGDAVFSDLTITEAGNYNIVFAGSGVDNVTSNLFTIVAANANASNTTAVVPNGSAGDPTQITITVEDSFGNRVEGVASNLSASIISGSNSGASVQPISDDGNGIYSTSYTPTSNGTDQIRIELNGSPISGSPFKSFVSTSDAANIEIEQEPLQTIAGQSIAGPPAVKVTDDLNNPVEDVEVSVSEQSGSSFSSGTLTVSTGGNGIATFNNLVFNIAGTYTLIFDAVGVSDNAISQSFSVTPADGDPGESSAVVPDGTAGSSTSISITVEDAFGNRVEGAASDLSVSISGDNAGASVATITDDGNGIYSTSYTPTDAGTDQVTITLNGSGISGSPFTSQVSAGSIAAYDISNISSPQTAGESFGITITARDANGNTATGYNGTANLSTTAGSISPTSTNFSSGTASQSVTVTNTGNNRTITATDNQNSSISVTSNNFNVVAGDVSSSVSDVSASPTSLTVGSSSTVTIQLRDSNGNPIGGLTNSNFSINLTGNATRTSVSETTTTGTYRFNVTDNTAENVTVTVNANGTELNDKPTITFQAGTASGISITTQPSATTAGNTISPAPAVEVTDAGGNPVAGITVSVSLSAAGFTGTSDTQATTNGSGIASFSNLVINTAGSYTITFDAAAAGVSNVNSNSFEVTNASAQASNTTADVPNGTAGSSTSISITVEDAFGNRVEGAASDLSVSISGDNAGASLATITDDGNGIYSTSYTPTDAGSDQVTITLNGSGISGSPFTSQVSAASIASYDISTISSPQTAGVDFSITITALDANGNTATGYNGTANLSTTAGSISPASTNFSSGTASQSVSVTNTGNNRTITATDDQNSSISVTSNEFDVVAGSASGMSITSQPSATTAGNTISPAPAVEVTDAGGNPVAGITVSVSLSAAGFTGTSDTQATTNGSGIASFSNLVINTAGSYTITFNADAAGVDNVNSSSFEVTNASAQASNTTADVPNGTAGETTTITITAEDAFGNRVEGVASDLSVTISGDNAGASVATITDDGNGIYSTSYTPTDAGTDQVTITLNGSGISGSPFTSQVSAGSIASYDISTISSPQTAGVDFSITITALDANGNTATGYNGTANLSTTAGSISPASTNFSSGTASQSVSVTNTGNNRTITATDDQNSSISVTSNEFDVVAGSASGMSITSQPSATTAGNTISPAPAVEVTDAGGNPVAGITVSVSLSAAGFTGTSDTQATTNGSGIASFSNLVINTAGSYTITFNADAAGVDNVNSSSFEVTNASAQASNTTADVPNGTAGETTTITITAEDAFGNRVEGVASDLSVTISGDNAGASVATITDDGNGIYSTSYTPTDAGTDQVTITLNGSGISGSPFTSQVSAGSIASYDISTISSPQTAGVDFSITITALDANGNTATGYNGTANLSTTAGSISPASTNFSSGTASQSVSVTNTGNNRTITATDDQNSSISVTSNEFDVVAGSASGMSITSQPSATTAGNTISPAPAVEVTDAGGNPVAGITVSVSLSAAGFTGTSDTQATTNGSGIASFSNLVINTAGSYTITFNADAAGVDNVNSSSFEVTNASAQASNTTADVPNGTAGETTTITITAEDAFGNRVEGVASDLSVTISGDNAGASVATITDDGNGIYSTSYTPTDAGTDQVTITLNGSGISGSPFTSQVSAGSIASYDISTISSPQTAGVDFSITITALDANGNTATGYNGTADLSTTAGTITPATTASFTSGTITLDVSVSEAGADQTITATDGTDNTISDTSNSFDVVSP